MSKALIHVRAVRRPISEEVIGFRLEAAVPNQDGRKMKARRTKEGDVSFYATQEATPSFRRPYFIAESSDYPFIDRRKVERFMKDLEWQGYREFELVGKYQGEPFALMMNA